MKRRSRVAAAVVLVVEAKIGLDTEVGSGMEFSSSSSSTCLLLLDAAMVLVENEGTNSGQCCVQNDVHNDLGSYFPFLF